MDCESELSVYVKSNEDYPVNLDDWWKKIGYSTKGNSAAYVKKQFKEGNLIY